jgi:YidC/Oxa1 family membrane protein insertase
VILHSIIIWTQIENALVWLLTYYESVVGSWGWAIVLLTFTIRLAMVPLTLKQFRSMAAMQIVQPKVKQLQNRYKGKNSREDRQKMQAELMELYKEHNVNPFGSCLPLLIQAPVFIALNAVLRYHIHPTGGVSFLGIPNIFLPLNQIGTVAEYTLIALYVGSMLCSTLLFSFVTDKQQKYMLAAMPIVFVPFVLRFSTGVMIYWITSNFWTLGQQGMIKRTMGHRFPQANAGKTGTGAGGKGGSGAGGSKANGKGGSGTDGTKGGKATPAGGKGNQGGAGGDNGGGKAVTDSSSAARPPRGGGRRPAQQAGRRSSQRRGGRKR